MEKAKADAVAEAYRQTLLLQQTEIDRQLTDLLAVEMERGLTTSEETMTSPSTSDHPHGGELTIAARKQALEEQRQTIEEELVQLQSKVEQRNKSLQGKFGNRRCFVLLLTIRPLTV